MPQISSVAVSLCENEATYTATTHVAERSNVIPSECEEPHKCGKRYASKRGPSLPLRMTALGAETAS
jgi:hypothetical protein